MNTLLTPNQLALWHRHLPAGSHPCATPPRHIIITCHRGPDGDAIGSTTALASWLHRRLPATTIHIIAPNNFPDFLKWIPGASEVLIYEGHEAEVRPIVEDADLVIMCDHGELRRMSSLGDVVREHPTPRIIIDHHLDPEPDIADLLISFPELSSTCEVLLRLILDLETAQPAPTGTGTKVITTEPTLTHDEAVSLYTGMMTDTGAFTYASSRPEIYELISILLSCGIDKDKIYRNVFFTYSPNRMKLMGYMLYVKLDVWKKAHTSLMTLTNAERRRFGILNGDTEGLVNLPLQILGMKLSIFLREDTEHPCIRVSLRSVDDFPCNEMAAEFFNGGGHKNASGGEVWGSLDDAIAIAKKAVQKYLPLLKSN
ncbi:MAG: DHH family phosphoesterase [Bacteroidales bacterium]|nr:DHH family phosphoesterase [Bacteroidales bacterium]